MSQIVKPKNGRVIAPRSCLTCHFNVYDDKCDLRVCLRSGDCEWGDPQDMSNYVCDGFKRYKFEDSHNGNT